MNEQDKIQTQAVKASSDYIEYRIAIMKHNRDTQDQFDTLGESAFNMSKLHLGTQPDDHVTIADFITIAIPPVAPRERKPRENPATFGGLAVGRERHRTQGGRGVVGRLRK